MRDSGHVPRFIARILGILAILSSTSCLSISDPPEGLAILTVVSGNNQNVEVGTATAAPLVVLALNQAAAPMGGVRIDWAINQGGGTLSTSTSTTADDGTASVTYTAPATNPGQPVLITAAAETLVVTFSVNVITP